MRAHACSTASGLSENLARGAQSASVARKGTDDIYLRSFLSATLCPPTQVIKKRIEDLIAREYMERDKENPNTCARHGQAPAVLRLSEDVMRERATACLVVLSGREQQSFKWATSPMQAQRRSSVLICTTLVYSASPLQTATSLERGAGGIVGSLAGGDQRL